MLSALNRRARDWAERDGRGYPDWAVRYLPEVRWLRRSGRLGGRIVEIGVNESGLARFADVPVIALDADPRNLLGARSHETVRPVACDAAALPFRNCSVDCLVCLDTLEHVPVQRRALVLNEAVRVLSDRGAAVFAFPSGTEAMKAETAVREEYRQRTGGTLQWLEEHAAAALPHPEEVADALRASGGPGRRVTVEWSGNLRAWRWTWRVLMCEWPGRGNGFVQAILRLLVPVLSRLHFGVCYRAVVRVEPRDA